MVRAIFLVFVISLVLPGGSYAATLCTYTFSNWGACQPNGTQQRTITSSSPAGCIDWIPALTQTCTYVPPATGPRVTFSPAATIQLSGGQVFDFSFSADFGPILQVTNFSVFYQGSDITKLLLDALAAGAVRMSVQGNVVTLTVPGIALPSGQHKIRVAVGSPSGNTVADWIVTISAPRYALSDDQKDLIARNGKPDYLTILFKTDPQRRQETWAYKQVNKMYTFWDGVRVSEDPITVDPAVYSRPPSLDPSLFTKDTTLQDIVQIIGGSYVEIDQTALRAIVGAIGSRSYYFAAKSLYATFVGDRLTVLKTTDILTGQ